MRDILTVIGGALVLLLAAALVVPPFVDWGARRGSIERVVARASGTDVRTEGRIEVRLLPWPRMRFESVRLGNARGDGPRLAAKHVKADIALAPLLGGEMRFTEARIGRAEITVPAAVGGELRLPPGLLAGLDGRAWAVEDLRIGQFLLTLTAPSTGRTDQIYAEGVRIEGRSLQGPWRAEGTSGGVPFRLAAGAASGGRGLSLKLTGGGDTAPQFDADARLDLEPSTEPGLGPRAGLSGSARITFGPPAQMATTGLPVPLTVQAAFKATGTTVDLDAVTMTSGEGPGAVELAGTGVLRIEEPRLALALEGRRLDADAYVASSAGEALLAAGEAWRWPDFGMPVDVDLKLDSLGLGGADWSKLALRASLGGGTALVHALQGTGPGETRIALDGRLGLDGQGTGRVTLASADPERAAQYLRQAGLIDSGTAALPAQPLSASAEFTLATPVAALRDVRIRLGDARVTGAARYTAPERGARARVEAQIAADGIDVARLPPLPGVLAAARDVDLGLVLDARDVRYGSAPGAGRISARVQSDGPSLAVDALEITDFAGASARAAGRLQPDGSGRIEGEIRAEHAAPLLDLAADLLGAGTARSLPDFVRGAGLDLHLVAEQSPPRPGERDPGLKIAARGKAAGGDVAGEFLTANGRPERVTLRVATANTGEWLERPQAPGLKRPGTLAIDGTRTADRSFALTVSGDLGGTRVTTARPLTWGAAGERPEAGALDIASADVSPFLVLLSEGAVVPGPVPAELRVELARQGEAARAKVSGRLAGGAIGADLSFPSASELSGKLTLDRLSLPWLAAAFALDPAPQDAGPARWSTARFGANRHALRQARATLSVRSLDLGRGLVADNATFAVALTPDSVTVGDLGASLADGRVAGAFRIQRSEGRASLSGEGSLGDVALSRLAGPGSPLDGRLSATLSFGASGASVAEMVANLAGSGDLRLSDLHANAADPTALARAVRRDLADADPLAPGRLEAIVAEELDRAPLTASSLNGTATMVGGGLRIGPLNADVGAGRWEGAAVLDLNTNAVEVRGTLTAKAPPRNWTGPPPSVLLGWKGAWPRLRREVDVASLTTGVAAMVLQRELDRIEDFTADANERARRMGRLEMDRARKAAEEARLRDERAVEDAARQARLRDEAEARRARPQPDLAPGAAPPRRAPAEPPPALDVKPLPLARPLSAAQP